MRVSLSIVAAVSIGATAASAAKPLSGALSRRAFLALPPGSVDVQSRKAAGGSAPATTSLAAAAVLRGGGSSPSSSSGVAHTVKVASLFGLWYALNVVYNIGRFASPRLTFNLQVSRSTALWFISRKREGERERAIWRRCNLYCFMAPCLYCFMVPWQATKKC